MKTSGPLLASTSHIHNTLQNSRAVGAHSMSRRMPPRTIHGRSPVTTSLRPKHDQASRHCIKTGCSACTCACYRYASLLFMAETMYELWLSPFLHLSAKVHSRKTEGRSRTSAAL